MFLTQEKMGFQDGSGAQLPVRSAKGTPSQPNIAIRTPAGVTKNSVSLVR